MIGPFDPNQEYDTVTEELWQYVFVRDNGLCQDSGKQGEEAHHIIYRSLGGKNCANNMILLSHKSHDHEHNKGRTRTVEYYQNRVKMNEEKLRRNIV